MLKCLDFTALRAPVAQLDRAFGYEPKGREFESLRARHFLNEIEVSEYERRLDAFPGHPGSPLTEYRMTGAAR